MSDPNDRGTERQGSGRSSGMLWGVIAIISVLALGLWLVNYSSVDTAQDVRLGSNNATENDAIRPDAPNLPPGSRR